MSRGSPSAVTDPRHRLRHVSGLDLAVDLTRWGRTEATSIAVGAGLARLADAPLATALAREATVVAADALHPGELRRRGIVAADPFETANALEAAKTQLETLYALTARLSRLNLADYLR